MLKGNLVQSDLMPTEIHSSFDVHFLLNDLRKYGKRSKFSLVYEPEIEEKISQIKDMELTEGRTVTMQEV